MLTINPWFAKVTFLVGTAALLVIPACIHRRHGKTKIATSRKGRLEAFLLSLTSVAFFLQLLWVATGLIRFADYPLHPVMLAFGILCLAPGLWLFYRSHADLGTYWSITLEMREKHELITQGIYRDVRHPMYLAILLYALGQALLIPNWLAGPSHLLAFALLVALRVGPEERMMLEEFGEEYRAYAMRTKRLVPGVW